MGLDWDTSKHHNTRSASESTFDGGVYQSGPIDLYTLRHSPGHLVHSLKGHTNVVSCMSLLPGEKGLLSGSWDGTLRV